MLNLQTGGGTDSLVKVNVAVAANLAHRACILSRPADGVVRTKTFVRGLSSQVRRLP